MGLSSFLLKSADAPQIDNELDGLFSSAKKALAASTSAAPSPKSKSKSKSEPGKKRKQVSFDQDQDGDEEKVPKKKKAKTSEVETKGKKEKKDKKAEEKKKKKNEEEETAASPTKPNDDGDLSASDDDDADTDSIPKHESLTKGSKSRVRGKKEKTLAPPDETPEQRDRRTIFIGNVPLEVASKRPLAKQLKRHILSFVDKARIESIRFRSIPFQTPTSKLPEDDDDKSKSTPKPKEARQHTLERSSTWRQAQSHSSSEKDTEAKDSLSLSADNKSYLTPSQKKKIAFLHKEFHTSADSVNVYIVFGFHPERKGKDGEVEEKGMDPYEAALAAVKAADGTMFEERVLRVDLAVRGGKGKVDPATKSKDGQDGLALGMTTDPKLSIFVGSLDFATKEEDLRAFFESILVSERGVPTLDADDESAGEEDGKPGTKKALGWVRRVRIVRDRETLLGKGFAYVQFLDRQCVDEILAKEPGSLKFAKRKLRVQRCKVITAKTASSSASSSQTNPESRGTRPRFNLPPIPKGDPNLGEKIAGLSKEDRKQVKADDKDRVARRMAKKKARMAMGPPGDPMKRDRERKPVSKKKKGFEKPTAKKPRERSDKSVMKRNMKK